MVRSSGLVKLYLAIFLTGVASIQMELSLLREAYFGMGTTLFTNSFIISTFLGGLAIGCYAANQLAKNATKNFTKTLFILIQFFNILAVTCFLFTKNNMIYLPHSLSSQCGYFFIFTFASSAAAGAVFSLFVKICFELGESYVSLIYAVGTLGNVLGGFLHGMLLVPKFGMISTYVFAFGSIGVAILLIGGLSVRKNTGMAGLIFGIAFLVLAFRPLPKSIKPLLLYSEDDPYGTVDVRSGISKEGIEVKRLFIDNEFNCSDTKKSISLHRNMAKLGESLANHETKSALILGYCSGETVIPLLSEASVERVVVVEQNKRGLEAAKQFFPEAHKIVSSDPRVIIENKEFKNYLKQNASDQKFDLVILDVTVREPYFLGLFTAEFFDLIKKHLTPRGGLLLGAGYSGFLRTAAEKFSFVYSPEGESAERGDFYLTNVSVPTKNLEAFSFKEIFPRKEDGLIYTDHRIYSVRAGENEK